MGDKIWGVILFLLGMYMGHQVVNWAREHVVIIEKVEVKND